MLENLEKILIMQVSATLTQAVAVNFPDNLTVSSELNTEDVKEECRAVWELHRSFYHAIVKSLPLNDPSTGWPTPNVGVADLVTKFGTALLPVLSGQGPLGTALVPLLQQILAGVGVVKTPAAAGAAPSPADLITGK